MWRMFLLCTAMGACTAWRPLSSPKPRLKLPQSLEVAHAKLSLAPKQVHKIPLLVSVAASTFMGSTTAFADTVASSLSAPVAASSMDSSTIGTQLFVYFLQTLISYGVPAFFILFVGFTLFSGRRRQRDEMGGSDPPEGPLSLFKKFSGGDRGLELTPNEEYIKVERLNDKLDSFQFSLQKATGGRQKALAQRRRQLLAEDLRNELLLTDEQLSQIEVVEKRFLKRERVLRRRIENARNAFRANALAKDPSEVLGAEDPDAEEMAEEPKEKAAPKNFFKKFFLGWRSKSAESGPSPDGSAGNATAIDDAEEADVPAADLESPWKAPSAAAVIKLVEDQSRLERDYLTEIGKVLTAPQRKTLMRILKARKLKTVTSKSTDIELSDPAVDPDVLPLPLLLANNVGASAAPRDVSHVYVLKFFGDALASQVSNLREEVTAVLQACDASRGDEVVIILNTGGGTVTGYGLAASQLLRLKEAGLRLTICVEQVAASGGYMMACTADHLVASPFAVLGSIGVITDIPNVYERLKREGIAFQTVTAGKYKRTLTPTKRITKQDVTKTKSDIESVLKLFKDFVQQQRPKLHIEKVATGETWFGRDALMRDLCDELSTPDDVLLRYRDLGAEIYSIEYEEPQSSRLMKLLTTSSSFKSALSSMVMRGFLSERSLPSLDASSAKLIEEVVAAELLKADGAGYGGLSRDAFMANDEAYAESQRTVGFGPMLIDERDTSNTIRADAGGLIRRVGNLLFDHRKY